MLHCCGIELGGLFLRSQRLQFFSSCTEVFFSLSDEEEGRFEGDKLIDMLKV